MAQQLINLGNSPNDGSGTPLRGAYTICNENFTEVYTAIQTLSSSGMTAAQVLRAKALVACTASAGQVITFSAAFHFPYALNIIDFEGLGIQVTANDANGFTITALTAGNFGYLAILEV